MKEKILALLVASFQGVRKDGLMQLARMMALQCATEEEAKGMVDKLTKAQVDEFIKDFRADVDKEVSESNKTFEQNLKKKFDFKEKKVEPGNDPNPKPNDPTDIAAIVKAAVDAAVAPLNEKLNAYDAKNIAESRLQSLNEKLASCKDDNFKSQTLKDFARMNFKTDDEFKEYLTEKETAIASANQSVADAALGGQGKPFFSQKEETGVSKGVAEYVAAQKPDANNVLTGKEI